MDANRNGLVERAEATADIADRFAQFDYNGDGVVSGAEIARGSVSDVHPPTITYIDRHTVTLGGKQVTMIHLGTAHADDSSVLLLPGRARGVQRRHPAGEASAGRAGARASARGSTRSARINALEFDHALTGHALSGTKKDAAESLRYLQELSTGVAAGVGARAQPAGDSEDAHARRLQGVRALGHGAQRPHRQRLRHAHGDRAMTSASRGLTSLLIIAASLGAGHGGAHRHARAAPPRRSVVSPDVSADRRITVRLYAPKAEAVRLDASDVPACPSAAARR